jgi:hypothetical protein
MRAWAALQRTGNDWQLVLVIDRFPTSVSIRVVLTVGSGDGTLMRSTDGSRTSALRGAACRWRPHSSADRVFAKDTAITVGFYVRLSALSHDCRT